MEAFSRLGLGLMLLVTALVGLRLLALAWRSGQAPETAVGGALLGSGVGAVLVVQGGTLAAAGRAAGLPTVLVGTALTSLGATSLCVGTWRIFRPEARWAAAVAVGAFAVLAASFAVLVAGGGDGRLPTDHPAYFVGVSVRILAFAWVGGESLGYMFKLRRQVSLGLARPIMVHRFFLWGLSSALSTAGYLLFVAFALLGAAPTPAAQGVMGLIGVVTASSMWIAFFPPATYQRWAEAAPSSALRD